jgi:hypothetical protein
MSEVQTYTAFCGVCQIAAGPLTEMIAAVKDWVTVHGEDGILYFDDVTGTQVDFNLREQVAPRPGRPRLGVVSREISLLPRHWEWLERQPNGASAALRRLVDQARKTMDDSEHVNKDATGRFLTAMAGNLPNYEEVTRALWRGEYERMADWMQDWPRDVRSYVLRRAGCEI